MEAAITQSARTDEFGHVTLGGVGTFLRDELEKRLGMETRVTVLGHVQRGGSPTAHDRVLATRFGVAAVELVREKDFGKMVALRGNDIVAVPLEEAVAQPQDRGYGPLQDRQHLLWGVVCPAAFCLRGG